jgi:hypothetical protein
MRLQCSDALAMRCGAARQRWCGGDAEVRHRATVLLRGGAAVRLQWAGRDSAAAMRLPCGGGTTKHRPVLEEDRPVLLSIVNVVIFQFVYACTHPKTIPLSMLAPKSKKQKKHTTIFRLQDIESNPSLPQHRHTDNNTPSATNTRFNNISKNSNHLRLHTIIITSLKQPRHWTLFYVHSCIYCFYLVQVFPSLNDPFSNYWHSHFSAVGRSYGYVATISGTASCRDGQISNKYTRCVRSGRAGEPDELAGGCLQ